MTRPTMHQGMIVSATTFSVERVERPELQDEEDLLLRTAASGICSGDLMEWYLQRKVGTVLGHEVVGYAHEVGSSVRHISPGQLVFVHHHAPCGDCRFCHAGDHVQCDVWRQSYLDPGGMAEYIRVPAINVRHDTFVIEDLSSDVGVFIEPLACSVKALQRVADQPRDFGVVVGCGVMGLLSLGCSQALGVKEMWAVDFDERRLRVAREIGASQALRPDSALAASASRPAAERADFVVVGPGSSEAIRQALEYVRPGGVVVLFTPTPTGIETSLDLGDLYFKDIAIVPSYSCGPQDTRMAYELLREGRIDVRRLITHRFRLAELQRAYDTAKRGGEALKVLVEFDAP